MSEHTPGPWQWKHDCFGKGEAEMHWIEGEDGEIVGDVTDWEAPDIAFALAAPDLLAACEALLRDVEEEGLEDTESAALARAAIAKARGILPRTARARAEGVFGDDEPEFREAAEWLFRKEEE